MRVFTSPSCAFCFVVKEFLRERGIAFEEIDTASDDKGREEMIKKSGQMTVPVLEIDGEIVVGFDREKIVRLLNIKD